tara:strand:- start:333 stop:887 length:555 start_codon:yes stop_codon:yes gene_type:complete
MEFKIYHYKIDNFNDCGFGCSYRNIQTILSAYSLNHNIIIPTIEELLSYFNTDYINLCNKQLWIEPLDISKYLLDKYNIKSHNVLYIISDLDADNMLRSDINYYIKNNLIYNNFNELKKVLISYLNKTNLPIVIDDGTYSYCLYKINNNQIILFDPHTTNSKHVVQIKNISFLQNKFWMICIPE